MAPGAFRYGSICMVSASLVINVRDVQSVPPWSGGCQCKGQGRRMERGTGGNGPLTSPLRAVPARPWRLWGGCGQRAPARRGRENLFHNVQTQNMRGALLLRTGQRPQRGGGIPNAVVCQNNPQFAAVHLGGYLHLHRIKGCAGRRCSADFPAPGPAMRGQHPALLVPLHRSGPDSRCSCRPGAYHKNLPQRGAAVARRSAFGGAGAGRRIAACWSGSGRRSASGCAGFGCGYPQPCAGPHPAGQSPAPAVRPSPGFRESGVRMSWLTPANQVGAGGIPLSNDLVAGLQLGAGLVQLLRQLPSHAGHRQGHGLPLCQSVQPLCHLLQTAAAPPAEGQTKCQDQTRPARSLRAGCWR